MTCAGITSLVIAADKVQASDARAPATDRVLRGSHTGDTDRIDRALQWLGRNYSVVRQSPRATCGDLLSLRLERVGRLTARRFLCTARARRPSQPGRLVSRGADWLVRKQDGLSGFWAGSGHAENSPLVGTSSPAVPLQGTLARALGQLQYDAATIEPAPQRRGHLARYVRLAGSAT